MGARDAVVIFSGGMDSTVAVFHALHHGFDVHTVSFDYGQRHVRELASADQVYRWYRENHGSAGRRGVWLDHTVLKLDDVAKQAMKKGALTDSAEPVPHGHYEAPSMVLTVVPNRNMIMLSIAAARADMMGYGHLMYGAHAGDHAIYPDCTPPFFAAAAEAIFIATGVVCHAPFLRKTKAWIACEGHTLGVPFHLTWSCYEGEVYHCGTCGTCVERKEAFKLGDVPDTTAYAVTSPTSYKPRAPGVHNDIGSLCTLDHCPHPHRPA